MPDLVPIQFVYTSSADYLTNVIVLEPKKLYITALLGIKSSAKSPWKKLKVWNGFKRCDYQKSAFQALSVSIAPKKTTKCQNWPK